MNKHELIKATSEKSGLSVKDADKVLDSFVKKDEDISEDISIVGFGSFVRVERSARTGCDFNSIARISGGLCPREG